MLASSHCKIKLDRDFPQIGDVPGRSSTLWLGLALMLSRIRWTDG